MSTPSLDDVLKPILTAARTAFTGLRSGLWDIVKNVVANQMKQIAISIVDIAEGLVANPPYYTAESGKLIVGMAINAAMSTIVTTTELVITEVQAAMKQILDAGRQQITALVGNILPAL